MLVNDADAMSTARSAVMRASKPLVAAHDGPARASSTSSWLLTHFIRIALVRPDMRWSCRGVRRGGITITLTPPGGLTRGRSAMLEPVDTGSKRRPDLPLFVLCLLEVCLWKS